MELVVKPVTTDIRYRVIFKEPQFELIKQESRISLLSKIMKNFDLHLNDIKLVMLLHQMTISTFQNFLTPLFLMYPLGWKKSKLCYNAPKMKIRLKTSMVSLLSFSNRIPFPCKE